MSPIRRSERARYPADWPAIRARILARAGGRCEFTRADGTRCNAPHGRTIARWYQNEERWVFDLWAEQYWPPVCYRTVRVVLTIAHVNHTPEDCRDENLRAWCQLHHLRHDVGEHRSTAAATRRAAKQNRELFPAPGSGLETI